MRRLRTWYAGLPLIAALYLLAAGMAGFVFHPGLAAPATASAPAMAAYALPDGTMPGLCLNDPAAPGEGSKDGTRHSCDFCRLAGAPGLLPEAPGVLHSISFLLIAALLLAGPVFAPRAVVRARSRAPPFVPA